MKNKSLRLIVIFAVSVFAALFIFAGCIYAASEKVREGDANGDGLVNSADLMLIRQYLASYDYENGISDVEIGSGADLDGDGKVSLKDVIELRRYLVDNDFTATAITESDGAASVVGMNGLKYTASNFSEIKQNMFVINTDLEIVLEEGAFAGNFNRLSFKYESSEPIKLSFTYELDGEEKTDYFFLEATKTEFRGLIEGYIYGNIGANLKKITVDTCEEVDAYFMLHDLTVEEIPVYDDDLCVENDRYKIGVRLSWGGAMTYFEDKMDGDDELANLVNIHDTGRLIQQSFYGTFSNGDYVSVPNGNSETATKWPYNPVQGGDRGNNGSDRLIDVEYDEEKDYIYIVCQSLDWAYVKGKEYETEYKGLTYTYYENTYSIMEGEDEGTDDDYVLVDNVMTDFSGWVHPAGGQEIPAVYLVSYFDTLSYYNGIKPWTGDTEGVYYEADLEGWSNAGSFPLYKGNTETWSIWINTDDNFGFGTFCPNIQKHIAIRHQYNGSKDPMNNATSYVAPSCSIVMQSYLPVEYSYILATGDPEDIRKIFEDNKDFTDNASLSENRYDQLIHYGKFDMMNMDFTIEDNVNIFTSPKHLNISYDSIEDALKILIENGSDPYVSFNFDWNSNRPINCDEFNTIEIEYMLPMDNSASGATVVFFISAGDVADYNEANTVNGTIIRDGEYHTLTIRVPKGKCEGVLHKMRFDPFTSAQIGDVMYIKSISLTTVDYPEIGVDNDLSVPGFEHLPTRKNYTDVSYDEIEKALKLMVQGGTDVGIELDFTDLFLSTTVYTGLEIEYMVPMINSAKRFSSSIYFSTDENSGFNGQKVVGSGTLTADGQYHTMVFDFTKEAEYWTGNITKLRFDYFENVPKDGDVMYVKRITFIRADGYEIDLSLEGGKNPFSSTKLTGVSFDETEGVLKLTSAKDKGDVSVTMSLGSENLSTEDYTKLVVRYMIPTTNSKTTYSSAVYFTTSDNKSVSESQAIYSKLIVDGNYHYVIYDLTAKGNWSGNIADLRFDYFQSDSAAGDVIYVESIYLMK